MALDRVTDNTARFTAAHYTLLIISALFIVLGILFYTVDKLPLSQESLEKLGVGILILLPFPFEFLFGLE